LVLDYRKERQQRELFDKENANMTGDELVPQAIIRKFRKVQNIGCLQISRNNRFPEYLYLLKRDEE